MQHDRTVIGYHGCDVSTVERLLASESFRPSDNSYDWLGRGIYFWEYGIDRALRFAEAQRRRGKIRTPAIIGAVIQLGHCFDLLDTRFTTDLATGYERWRRQALSLGVPIPANDGGPPDWKLR